MKKSTSRARQLDLMPALAFSALMIFTLGVLSSFSANAAEMTANEEMYLQLHKSIAAQERCSANGLTRAEHQKLAGLIDQAVNYDIGAGKRLSLIQKAKADVRNMTTVKAALNCNGDEIKALTGLFEEKLKGAM